MEDVRLSASWVMSALCWIVGIVLVVLAALTETHVAPIGLVFVAGGVTLSIKGFFHRLWECEVTAFRLGQQAEREVQERAGVRSLR